MSTAFSATNFLALLTPRVDQANAICRTSHRVQTRRMEWCRPCKKLTDVMMLTPQRPGYTGTSNNLLCEKRKGLCSRYLMPKNRTEPRIVDVLSHKLGLTRSRSSLFVFRHIAKAEDRLRVLVTHHQPIRHSTDSTDTVDDRRSWIETVKVRLMTKR